MSCQEAIDQRYFYLQLHYTELMNKCTNSAQQNAIATQFTEAEACREEALDKTFNEGAAAVAATRESLRQNTASLEQQMEQDEQIVVVLGTLTAGGQLAQTLVGFGQ